MFSHDWRRNSRTGIVCHTVGSQALENVCLAVTGSCGEIVEMISILQGNDLEGMCIPEELHALAPLQPSPAFEVESPSTAFLSSSAPHRYHPQAERSG